MGRTKFNKIIAREGLLIIALFILGLISILAITPISSMIENPIRKYENANNLGREPGFDKSKGVSTEVIVDKNNVDHWKSFDENDIFWKHVNHLRFLMNLQEGLTKTLWIFVIIFWLASYPLYLLIRFIVWAFKTLNEK